MRVTNSIVRGNLLRNIMEDSRRLARAQMQVATGLRFQKVSEDPISAQTVITMDSRLRALSQYRRNINAARIRTSTEEAALDQITDILTRAKELAISQASDTATAQTRRISAGEVEQLLAQVLQLGNSKVGSEYIFGGNQTSSAPFDTAGAYSGDSARRQARIGSGYVVDLNHSGQQLLVDSEVISSLQALVTGLQSGDATSVSAVLGQLDRAFDATQGLLAEIGGLSKQINLSAENINAVDANLTTVRSEVRDIGLDEASIDFFAVQTSLQAAMASAGRILNLNLTEYLR